MEAGEKQVSGELVDFVALGPGVAREHAGADRPLEPGVRGVARSPRRGGSARSTSDPGVFESVCVLHLRATFVGRCRREPCLGGAPRAAISGAPRRSCRGRAPPDGAAPARSASHARKPARGVGSRQAPHQEGDREARADSGSVASRSGADRSAGPVSACGGPRHPTWAEQVASFCPVRELLPGDRPADWLEQGKLSAPERMEAPVGKPLQYKVQFTATEEYVDLMERAAALLSNRGEDNGIEQIQLRALRLLVERLEKRRFGAPESSSKEVKKAPDPAAPRSRHIPARVRRAVFERDGARCTHVDASGQRCRETHHLELHHLLPFARGGAHAAANLTLRCAAHNAHAAELDFGPEHIGRQRDSCPHESERRAWLQATSPAAVAASAERDPRDARLGSPRGRG